MNILVLDVAADSGGALVILKQFYETLQKDTKNHYFFCVSGSYVDSCANITVLEFPWVKKSWLHRLKFDYIFLQKLMKKHKIESVLSLQNLVAPRTKLPQTIYLHQSLPYADYRFSFRENKKLWVYQNIIAKLIHHSVRRAERVIVQTQWIKDAIVEKDGISADKVQKMPPKVEMNFNELFSFSQWNRQFFYPADSYSYKNHIVILKAIKNLVENGYSDFQVLFTLTEFNLPEDCKALYEQVKPQVILLGQQPRDQVLAYYTHTILIFPSYIETFGLPLLEARMTQTPILASNCPFSREILEGYEAASLFDPFDERALVGLMEGYLAQT